MKYLIISIILLMSCASENPVDPSKPTGPGKMFDVKFTGEKSQFIFHNNAFQIEFVCYGADVNLTKKTFTCENVVIY